MGIAVFSGRRAEVVEVLPARRGRRVFSSTARDGGPLPPRGPVAQARAAAGGHRPARIEWNRRRSERPALRAQRRQERRMTDVARLRPAAREVVYPTSDGEPMAETDKHRDLTVYVIEALKAHFAARPDVY